MTLGSESIAWSNQDPSLKARIPMNGPFNRFSGYGNHFCELVLGMLRLGADVRVLPEHVEPPLPPELLATLLQPWDFLAPVAIRMANPSHQTRRAPHTIGITTWETSKIPTDEIGKDAREALDTVLVPCHYNIRTMQEIWPNANVHFVPEGVDTDFFTFQERDWQSRPTKIGAIGALTYRKGIDLTIGAFLDVFEGNPNYELHLATSVPSLDGQLPHLADKYDNIFVERIGWWSREQLLAWYHDKHALLYPFRGEGWGMCGPEMMATGGLVLAPNQMGAEHWSFLDTNIVIPTHIGPVLHWGPEWHGKEAADRYGEFLHYEPDAVPSALKLFAHTVETTPSVLTDLTRNAAGLIGFRCNWDFAAQKTIDHFIDALRAA